MLSRLPCRGPVRWSFLAQIREMRLTQVELALDAAAGFVLQLAVAVEIVDRVTLSGDQLQLNLVVVLDQLPAIGVAMVAMLDIPQPVAVARVERMDNLLRQLVFRRQLLQPCDRRLDRLVPGMRLLPAILGVLARP